MSKKYFYFVVLFVVMIPVSMISQSLSGVVSGDSSPVVGATVMVKSTNNGTSTDVDGKYQLTLEAVLTQ